MTRRKKINPVKFLRVMSFTLLIAFSVFFFSFKSTASGLTNDSYTEITVSAGDTLWYIADRYNGDQNIQEVICDIMECNNLQSTGLYPGQILKIPTKS